MVGLFGPVHNANAKVEVWRVGFEVICAIEDCWGVGFHVWLHPLGLGV